MSSQNSNKEKPTTIYFSPTGGDLPPIEDEDKASAIGILNNALHLADRISYYLSDPLIPESTKRGLSSIVAQLRSGKVKDNSIGTLKEECNKQHQVDPNEEQVNNPTHYQSMVPDLNIDAISCMRAAFGNEEVASFCICNALKYIFRHQSKNGRTDILKAVWYLNKYLELNK
jgi:hypothetical protein